MKTSTSVVAVLVVVVLAGGLWWYMSSTNPAPTPAATDISGSPSSNSDTAQNNGTQVAADVGVSNLPTSAIVTYGPDGFSPKVVTIAKGGTVSFVTQSAGGVWVAADEHPTHTKYDGTTRSAHCAAGYAGEKPFDQCVAGANYSFVFNKVGSFDYHNHSAAQFVGTVIVK